RLAASLIRAACYFLRTITFAIVISSGICSSLPDRAATLPPSFPAPCEFYVTQDFVRTISQKRMTVSNGIDSQARIAGTHQRTNKIMSVALAGETGTRKPS